MVGGHGVEALSAYSLDQPTTLNGWLKYWSEHAPTRQALQFMERTTSFKSLSTIANQIADGLQRLGLTAGNRVIYYSKNADDFYYVFFGAAQAGIVTVPINWRSTAVDAADIAADCAAAAIFVSAEFRVELARNLSPEFADVPIFTVGNPSDVEFLSWVSSHSGDVEHDVHASDVALQLYTSGTTGTPKGVMLSHANILVPQMLRQRADIAWDRWLRDDTTLLSMPFGHIGGCRLGLLALCGGSRALIISEFDAGEVIDLIERERITKAFFVPTALHSLVHHPRAKLSDFSSLRLVMYGAAPMPPQILRDCIDRMGCGFVQFYGMTETCGAIVALGPEDHNSIEISGKRVGSTGLTLPGVELAIIDADGALVPVGTAGEIITRSASNMVGYWKQTEATDLTISKSGWLHTGDVGALDGQGYLYILDRLKDMVITGGENVYSIEVEAILSRHPSITECAVIGIPDPKWGETVVAVVVVRAGFDLEANSLIEWAKLSLPGFKTPKSIIFADHIDKNSNGKILKRELRRKVLLSDRVSPNSINQRGVN